MKDAKDRAGRAVAAPSLSGQVATTGSPASPLVSPMQPPQIRPWLLQQIEQLKEQAARQAQATPPSPPSLPASKVTCPPVDYKQLIQHWYAKEPPALRHRKYHMAEFLLRFSGRFRPKPATRLIAEALRELGWTEHRDWTRAGRNRRYWCPPSLG